MWVFPNVKGENSRPQFNSGILMDKTIDDKLMFTPNYDIQKYYLWRLNLLVENIVTDSLY